MALERRCLNCCLLATLLAFGLTATSLWWLLPPRPQQTVRFDEEWELEGWSPDGRLLAFSTANQVLFWDLAVDHVVSHLSFPHDREEKIWARNLSFDRTGNFAIGTLERQQREGGGIRISTNDQVLIDTVRGERLLQDPGHGACFFADGRRVPYFATSALFIWDCRMRAIVHELGPSPDYGDAFVMDDTGHHLAWYRADADCIDLWDLVSGRCVRTVDLPRSGVHMATPHLRFRPDGRTLEFVLPIDPPGERFTKLAHHQVMLIDWQSGQIQQTCERAFEAGLDKRDVSPFPSIRHHPTTSQALLWQPLGTQANSDCSTLRLLDAWSGQPIVDVSVYGSCSLFDHGGMSGPGPHSYMPTVSPSLNYVAVEQNPSLSWIRASRQMPDPGWWASKWRWLISFIQDDPLNEKWHRETTFTAVADQRTLVLPGRGFFAFSEDGSQCITWRVGDGERIYEVWSLPFRPPWALIVGVSSLVALSALGVGFLSRYFWRRPVNSASTAPSPA